MNNETIIKLPKQVEEITSQLDSIAYFVTPQMYGAIGNGKADDTEAINKACETGLPVVLPEVSEHYKVTSPIYIKNTITFNGKIIVYGANGDETHRTLIIDGCKNININNPLIDLQWHGETVGEQDHAIYIINSENIKINGGEIKNCPGDNVYIGKKSKNITIDGSTLLDAYRCNVAITDAIGVNVRKCKLESNSMYVSNIDVEPNTALDFCEDIIIEGNTITNTNGTNVFVSILREGNINNVKILNNTMSATKRNITSLYLEIGSVVVDGNTFKSGEESIRINANFDKFTISNNDFIDFTTQYIISFGKSNLTKKSKLLKVENNTFNGKDLEIRQLFLQEIETVMFNNNSLNSLKTPTNEVLGNVTFRNINALICNNNNFKNVIGFGVGIQGNVNDISFIGNNVTFNDNITGTKGFVRTGADTVINNLKTNNNISMSATIGWTIWNGAKVPQNNGEYTLNKTLYGDINSLPNGTYLLNDVIVNTGTTGNTINKCNKAGTVGTLTSLTFSNTANTNTISVNDSSTLKIGEYLKCGAFTRKITSINDLIVTLENNITASYTNEPLTYSKPTFV